MPDWRAIVERALAEAGIDAPRRRDLAEELAAHLQDRFDELRAAGVSDEEATARASAELDDPPALEALAAGGQRRPDAVALGEPAPRFMSGLWLDVRYAFRMLRKHASFTAIAIATLAIGVGANAAMFDVVNAVLLRPLPFLHAERLVRVFRTYSKIRGGIEGLSPADFTFLTRAGQTFEAAATYVVPPNGFTLVDGGAAETVYGARVSDGFFATFGVAPLVGRVFERGDDAPGAPERAVIGEAFWRRRFAADPSIVGRAVRLDDRATTIVGVVPGGFWYPRGDRADVWVVAHPAEPTRQGPWGMGAVARLRPGITPAQTQIDLDRVAAAVERTFPIGGERWTLVARPLQETLSGDLRPVLWLLLAAAILVLAIACVNVANLMLAQATVRTRELAVRAALGASRSRVARQLLTESALLAAFGGIAGILVGWWTLAAMRSLAPENLQLLRDVPMAIDAPVFVYAAVLAGASAVAFGLSPALLMARAPLAEAIADGGRSGDSTGWRRLRRALVVAEFALSVLLLVGAGLVTRSLMALAATDPGIRTDHLLTATVSLPAARYGDDTKQRAFFDRLLTAVRRLPGADRATLSYGLPPDGIWTATNFRAADHPPARQDAEPIADFLSVDPEFFPTLAIPLRRGRLFDARDSASAPAVMIVNDTLARRIFPGEDPIGRTLIVSGNVRATIVGVVGDVKYGGLETTAMTLYGPFAQNAAETMALLVRGSGDPANLTESIRAALARIDPDVALGRARTMDALMSAAVDRPRFRTALLAAFAIVALVLAAIGIYGVMAYSVVQRTREIGVRLALGATPASVRRMVLREGLGLALAGAALGAVGALALARTIGTLLYGVGPADPITLTAVSALLLAVTLSACWLPARRATRTDPLAALRGD